MDLETEPPQEWKKDEDSIYDTLNEVGNISRELDDFATIDSTVKGQFISFILFNNIPEEILT